MDSGDVPFLDLKNMLPYSHADTILLLDDTANSLLIQDAWKRMHAAGFVQELLCKEQLFHQQYASVVCIHVIMTRMLHKMANFVTGSNTERVLSWQVFESTIAT